jgi:hypothetical protein
LARELHIYWVGETKKIKIIKRRNKMLYQMEIFCRSRYSDLQEDINEWLFKNKNKIKIVSTNQSEDADTIRVSIFYEKIYQD